MLYFGNNQNAFLMTLRTCPQTQPTEGTQQKEEGQQHKQILQINTQERESNKRKTFKDYVWD